MWKRAIPHLSIVFAVMLLVLFSIDTVNNAMGFLRGNQFRTLLLLSIVASIATGVMLIARNWKDDNR